MLRNEEWSRAGAVNIQPIKQAENVSRRRAVQAVFAGVAGAMLLAGSVAGYHVNGDFGKIGPKVAVAKDLSETPYDFAPSTLREQVLDRREAGQAVPRPSRLLVEEENRAHALELLQTRALVSKYFGEIQSRDAAIAKLNQTVQSDQDSLAKLASQLGLPKDRIAEAMSSSDQMGVGAATALDLAAFHKGTAPAAAPGPKVSTAQDLQELVARYLNLPCPLAAGDPRCKEAVDHAREQLARGHGLDANKPDSTPVLKLQVSQPFGPTDLELEPLKEVNGQMVHFHDGVDIPADYDEPVMAAGSGKVVFSGVAPSGALTVEIAHPGGLHTIYMHEDQLLVQEGQTVQKGQIIGLVGSTGMSTGPHVHFMVQDPSGTPIDPLPFIK